MAHWKSAAASAAAISIYMTGSAAFADVTSEQVWNDWKDYMTGFGYQINSTESQSGDTLVVSDLSMVMTLPEAEGTVNVQMGQMSFTENGDGTVSITIPPQMPVTLNMRPTTGEDVDAVIDYNTRGNSMIVSGDPGDMTHNFSMAEATISLSELIVEGTPVEVGSARVSIQDITGSSNMKLGDLRQTTQRLNTGPVKVDVDFASPEGDGQFVLNGAYNSMSFDGGGFIPNEMDPEDIGAMLAAGFAFDGIFTSGGGHWNFNLREPGNKVTEGSSRTGGGTLSVAMDQQRVRYAGDARDVSFNIIGGDIPIPIEMAMAKSGFNLLIPIAKGEEEQDFAFGITMGDFTMSDLIWGIFDQRGALPRDPATIAMDLTGKAKLLVDIMDPEAMAAVDAGEQTPGELNSVQLNSLTVSAAGAELTGGGAFTFDNSDTVTFDGVPAPTGAVDLKLVGGNGLLDALVSMGLLPEDQAMGARLMMGLFAVPGDGDDTLTSKIEVTGDGQIKANGQRLR